MGLGKKWRNTIVTLCCLILLFLPAANPYVYAASLSNTDFSNTETIVLLYHSGFQNEQVMMPGLYNLIAHFPYTIKPINIDKESADKEQSLLKQASGIFYLADSAAPDHLSVAWKKALERTTSSIYYFGGPIYNDWPNFPFRAQGVLPTITNIQYKGGNFPLSSMVDVNNIQIVQPKQVEVHATVDNGGQKTPFIVSTILKHGTHSQTIYYSSRFTPFSVISYVIADTLFDFFGKHVQEQHQIYLRIEDVHPLTDPVELRKIADFLYQQHVPYMVAVIPIYQKGNEQVTLNEKPQLVQALQYMQAHGGTIIMHGDTHQYYASETGEGYEFWDSRNKAPIPNEEQYDNRKIQQGLELLLSQHLYPVAFEPPHYAMTQKGYAVVNQYFSTLIGDIQTTKTGFVTESPPYMVTQGYGSKLQFYPENGGYVTDETPEVISGMLNQVQQVSLVRNSLTGVFYHPFLSLQSLKQLVQGLKSSHLEFFNIRNADNTLRSKWGNVVTHNGKLQVSNLASPALPAKPIPSGLTVLTSWLSWGIASIVTIVLVVFVLEVNILRRRRAVRIFEEVTHHETYSGRDLPL